MKRVRKRDNVLPRGIRRRGDSLIIHFTHDGRRETLSLGHVTGAQALARRADILRQIKDGTYVRPSKGLASTFQPAPKAPPVPPAVTFAAICDSALEYYRTKRSWDRVEGHVDRFKGWWAGRAAESISTAEINEMLFSNLAPNGRSWSKTTCNEYRITLLGIYKLAMDAGTLGITVNPVAKAIRHREKNSRRRVLSFAEEDRLRTAIRAKYPKKEVELDLALHLGCRRSNLYGQHASKREHIPPLDWRDVNLDFRIITFPTSKNGQSYSVPINDTALAALKVLRERCGDPANGVGPVVRKPSGIELHSSRKWFDNSLASAKIEDFRWHDLRHTFATRLRSNKVAVEDIRELLGHGRKSITERYANPDMDLLAQAVHTLDSRKAYIESVHPTVLQFPASQAG